MELKDKLQNLSKHSEHRRTSPLSCLAVFLCRGQLGQAGSIPAHGYCDILLHTGSSKESHVISQNADIRRSAKDNK
jgi:hypothetical protein